MLAGRIEFSASAMSVPVMPVAMPFASNWSIPVNVTSTPGNPATLPRPCAVNDPSEATVPVSSTHGEGPVIVIAPFSPNVTVSAPTVVIVMNGS